MPNFMKMLLKKKLRESEFTDHYFKLSVQYFSFIIKTFADSESKKYKKTVIERFHVYFGTYVSFP